MVSLIVFPVIIFPHWKLRIPVLIVACALIGLFGWQIWPRKEAALSFTSTMEKAQQSSVLSKPVENPYQHTAAPTTSRQLRTPSVAKQQDCQSGSICNQDSLVDAPQTVIDRSQSAVRITNNGGEISGIAVNGAAVVGPNTSERAQSLVHLKSAGSAIRDVPIQDAKLCNFPTWDDYLDCIVTDPSWAEGWAKMYHNATKKRLQVPLCGKARQTTAGRHWEETATETIWRGEYRNCDYGYYVLLPDHIIGHSSKAPNPNDGFSVDLEKSDSTLPTSDKARRNISAWNHYNAAELPTLKAIADNELRLDAGSKRDYHILSRSSVKMATLPAIMVKASYNAEETTVYEIKIIAYRPHGTNNLGDMVYVLSLVTNEASRAEDTITFNKILAGFRLTALPLGSCTNDRQ
jgi:hypothetical protein